MLGLSLSPVYNCTHVKADILKRSHGAFLHSMQISWLVVHQDGLHAALEGALWGWKQGLQKVTWKQAKEENRQVIVKRRKATHENCCGIKASGSHAYISIEKWWTNTTALRDAKLPNGVHFDLAPKQNNWVVTSCYHTKSFFKLESEPQVIHHLD